MSNTDLREKIVRVLESIVDPEIGIDVYNLGLIYNIEIVDEKRVKIDMSLTTMFCPLASTLPLMVIDQLKEALNLDADINIVYDPPWNPLRMTPKGREMFKERFGYDIVEQYEASINPRQE
ncbi:MAG: metal-sulfur cluster assembly factor [Thermosphaera sp.]